METRVRERERIENRVHQIVSGQERVDKKGIGFTLKPWKYDDKLAVSRNRNDTGGYVDELKRNQPRRRDINKPYIQARFLN